jgi:hypothetical protein
MLIHISAHVFTLETARLEEASQICAPGEQASCLVSKPCRAPLKLPKRVMASP